MNPIAEAGALNYSTSSSDQPAQTRVCIVYVCRIARVGTTRRIDRILELIVSGWTGLWNPNGTLFSGFTGSLGIVAMFAHFFTFVETAVEEARNENCTFFLGYRITELPHHDLSGSVLLQPV